MPTSNKDKKIIRHKSLTFVMSHVNKYWKFHTLNIHKGIYELELRRKYI